MIPANKLMDKAKALERVKIMRTCSGIVPVRALPPRSNSVRCRQCAGVAGMHPHRLF